MAELETGDISREQVLLLLQGVLGPNVRIGDVTEVHVSPNAVAVTMYAADSAGQRFRDGEDIAMTTVTRRIV